MITMKKILLALAGYLAALMLLPLFVWLMLTWKDYPYVECGGGTDL